MSAMPEAMEYRQLTHHQLMPQAQMAEILHRMVFMLH